MPLLKRKRLEPVKLPLYDATKKESRNAIVWYSPTTKEIFKDYSEYLKRIGLYRKPIWQCESTGKSNLTYQQALESEKVEKEKVQEKLPEELQKRVLTHVQFQTLRLDAVVDDVYKHFQNRYVEGETVQCTWDNAVYNAKILGPAEKPNTISVTDIEKPITADNNDEHLNYYKVQLVDFKKNAVKVVAQNELKRDRLAFSKSLLKKFIRDCTIKDTYIGAPWIIRTDIAERFSLDTTLPVDLQAARDVVYAKSRKKRTEAAIANGTANSSNDSSNTANENKISKQPITIDARRLEATLKYPMEDLNLPMYRRDPSGLGSIIDMTPGTLHHSATTPNPTGNMPLCPNPKSTTTVPSDCYGSFLMVWSFLGVFSHPLKLSPFSLDDFENALHHHSHSTILMESNVTLLNAIIKQRERLKKESLGHGSTAAQAAMSLYGTGYQASRPISATTGRQHVLNRREEGSGSEDEDDDEDDDEDAEDHVWRFRPAVQRRQASALVERGCGSTEVEAIGHNWDNGTVDTEDERVGWEDILIGFINQLAPLECLDDIDRILNHLVPFSSCTLEDRENAYISLNLRDKVKIFELLLMVANESHVIKSYMEECQDQMTELRKQKIELSRERRRIQAERREMEDKQNEENNQTPENPDSDNGSDRDEDDDEEDGSDNEDDHTLLKKAQRKAEQLSRHESRQATLKRHQSEREEREAKRLKIRHLQREEARARNNELKIRSEVRRKLDEDERVMHKKEEQVERDMRKYSNHRIKPLGRDKFYNRYYYLDDIGGTLLHGSGRLFVQSPSDTDLMSLYERGRVESLDTSGAENLPCGRGGGIKFVCELMKGQGMQQEAEFMEERVKKILESTETVQDWWQIFEEPEDIEKLQNWLNPKGFREFKLIREIEKQLHNITNGMKKRVLDQTVSSKLETARRNTRSKATPQYPAGSWLAYTNKLA